MSLLSLEIVIFGCGSSFAGTSFA